MTLRAHLISLWSSRTSNVSMKVSLKHA